MRDSFSRLIGLAVLCGFALGVVMPGPEPTPEPNGEPSITPAPIALDGLDQASEVSLECYPILPEPTTSKPTPLRPFPKDSSPAKSSFKFITI